MLRFIKIHKEELLSVFIYRKDVYDLKQWVLGPTENSSFVTNPIPHENSRNIRPSIAAVINCSLFRGRGRAVVQIGSI